MICSTEPNSAEPDSPVSKTGGSRTSRTLDETSKTTMTSPDDWRTPLIHFLENPGHTADRKVGWQALKYVMLDNTLYRQTIDGLLLKYLGSDQSEMALGEVREGICGTHQLAHKMKWLLRHAGFYWPTMLDDCFRYNKGCESCQKFGDVQLAPVAMLHPIIKSWPFFG
jgi:hypothetical protein